MRENRSELQKRIVRFIAYYQKLAGVSPSFDDIAYALDTVKSVVAYHIDRLEEDGEVACLRDSGGKRVQRSVRLVDSWGKFSETFCEHCGSGMVYADILVLENDTIQVWMKCFMCQRITRKLERGLRA